MQKFLSVLKQIPNLLKPNILFSVKQIFSVNKMGDNSKKISVNVDEVPAKKIKLDKECRTVKTMCGSWRPEETDGGLVLVFKTRDPGLSPDPGNERDFPENIEDFWVADPSNSDDNQESPDQTLSRRP